MSYEVRETCDDYTLVENGTHGVSFSNGWYVFKGNVTYDSRVEITGGKVIFILLNGCNVNAKYGIGVSSDAKLTIWGQSGDEGVLNANGKNSGRAGIGGQEDKIGGDITIIGGTITAKGGGSQAGTGCKRHRQRQDFSQYFVEQSQRC